MTITNCIKWRLADSDRFVLTSDIPSDQIAIFTDNLFFNWQKEVAECAEAIRQVLKEEGKRYFIIACHSTFLMEDMRHILESGLGKMAGHAFVYSNQFTYCDGTWKNVLDPEGAAVVFEII
jgi:hypothetical protein